MKTFRKILILGLAVIGIVGCESYLDVPPDATITESQIFGTYYSYQGFIDQMYDKVVDYNSHAICCSQNMGGESIAVQGWTNSYMASRGNFYAISETARSNYIGYNGGGIWDYSWQGIRIANIALKNLNMLVNASTEERMILKAQAHFFRAFFHWEIARAYGTIPYIDTVLISDFKLPRHWEYKGKIDYQAVTEKIVEDLDKAIEGLPVVWSPENLGRATKGAALALKAKALLFAGSPLMNEFSGNTTSFDTDYMNRAAEAAAEVLKLADNGTYALVDFELSRQFC